MFSKSCQYAIQATLYIAMYGGQDRAVKLSEISGSQEIPIHFLGKIMQTLAKNKIVRSATGPTGGFYLQKSPRSLRLVTIVKIIDGLEVFEKCGIGFKKCSDLTPCPLHNEFKKVKKELKNLLTNKSVSELCNDVLEGNAFVSFNLNDKAQT